jgi:hypothetical protein
MEIDHQQQLPSSRHSRKTKQHSTLLYLFNSTKKCVVSALGTQQATPGQTRSSNPHTPPALYHWDQYYRKENNFPHRILLTAVSIHMSPTCEHWVSSSLIRLVCMKYQLASMDH